jgi:hypothetical protein
MRPAGGFPCRSVEAFRRVGSCPSTFVAGAAMVHVDREEPA